MEIPDSLSSVGLRLNVTTSADGEPTAFVQPDPLRALDLGLATFGFHVPDDRPVAYDFHTVEPVVADGPGNDFDYIIRRFQSDLGAFGPAVDGEGKQGAVGGERASVADAFSGSGT